jgi:hypothetical protein
MHIIFSYSHKFNIYLQQKSFNKKYTKASRRRERPWTTSGGLLPPHPDILGALAIIEPSCHHHGLLPPGLLIHLLLGLLLYLLSGLLLLLLGLLLLPSSTDILSQYLVVLSCLLKFFLG